MKAPRKVTATARRRQPRWGVACVLGAVSFAPYVAADEPEKKEVNAPVASASPAPPRSEQAQGEQTQGGKSTDDERVLATLGRGTITQAEVDFQLGRVDRGEQLPALSTAARESTIYLIALQRRALRTLREQGEAASTQDVEDWFTNRSTSLFSQPHQEIVAEIAERTGVEPDAIMDHVAFRLSWRTYLLKHLTEDSLVMHFERHTARFDGTQFKIDLISLPVPAGASSSRDRATAELEKTLDGMLASPPGESPPAWPADREGARAGIWVRGGDLDPALIDHLLAMRVGEVAGPLSTATGSHLMRLLERKAGNRELDQARDDVRAHMLIFLLEQLAEQSQEQLPLVSKSSE